MLNSTEVNLLMNKVNKAFDNIGKTNGTVMPKSERNTEQVAYEMHIATHLARLAEGRKDAAYKAAMAAGVIPNYREEPRDAGTKESIYCGDVVTIALNVRRGSTQIDGVRLVQDLLESGVDQALVARLATKHTKTSAAPHVFTTLLVTG